MMNLIKNEELLFTVGERVREKNLQSLFILNYAIM